MFPKAAFDLSHACKVPADGQKYVCRYIHVCRSKENREHETEENVVQRTADRWSATCLEVTAVSSVFCMNEARVQLPSKPLTLDIMKTLDLIFFQKGLLLSICVLRKNEWNKSSRRTFDLESRFCSFLSQNSPEEATNLAENGPMFPWGPKLETFAIYFTVYSERLFYRSTMCENWLHSANIPTSIGGQRPKVVSAFRTAE